MLSTWNLYALLCSGLGGDLHMDQQLHFGCVWPRGLPPGCSCAQANTEVSTLPLSWAAIVQFTALGCCVQSTGGLRSAWLCWRVRSTCFVSHSWEAVEEAMVCGFGCDCQPSCGADHPGGMPAVVQALLALLPALTPSSWLSSVSGPRQLQHQEQPTRCSDLHGNRSGHLLHITGRLSPQEGHNENWWLCSHF